MLDEVKEVSFSSKNIPLKIICFIIAIIIAVVSFSIAFSKLNTKEEGFYQLNLNKNHELYQKSTNYTMMYKLHGSNDSIKQQLEVLNLLYEQSFSKIAQLVDSENTYENVNNIAYINQHLNEEIEIDEKLYQILMDAYNKTNNSLNYSIFSSPLFQKWEKYSSFDELTIKEFDPYYNLNEEKEIKEIVLEINNLQHFNLQFIDEKKHTICFNVSDSYQQFLNDCGLKKNYIDLNILSDAYILDYLIQSFKNNYYEEGYIYSKSGMLINMSKNESINYYLNDFKENQIFKFGNFKINKQMSLSQFRHFDSSTLNYYIIKDEQNKNIYRHPYINIHTGYPNQFLLNSYILSDKDVIYNSFMNNELQISTQKEQLLNIIKNQNISLLFTQNEEDKKLYLISNENLEIELISAYKYQLIQL